MAPEPEFGNTYFNCNLHHCAVWVWQYEAFNCYIVMNTRCRAEQSPLLLFCSYNGRQAVFGLAVTTAGNHNKVYMELASAAAIRCPNGFFSGAGTEPDVLRTSCSPLPLPGWGQRHHSVRGRWKRPRLWFCHVKVGFTPLVPHSSFCLCSLCHMRQCFRVRRRRRRKRRRELPEHGGGLTRI